MTKIKAALNDSNSSLRHPKNGSINKKKHQKFKNTPTGKVAIINGAHTKSNNKQMSPKNGNHNKSLKAQKLFKSEAFDKNGGSPKKSPKTNTTVKKEDDDDDSDEDINEGIFIKEEISEQENEVESDDSSEDADVPDIFGTSLANETDDSDEEFDIEDDDADVENKGVKMFKGIERIEEDSKKSNKNDEDDDEEDDDEAEDDNDDDEEDDEADDDDENEAVLGLSALLGDSIKDESGDEDFVGSESSEDDDDDVDEDDDVESDDEVADQSLNSSKVNSTDDDNEEDDDESTPDLTDLLGNSLADDSDDDDFEGDDDDDSEDDDDIDMSEDEEDELSDSLQKQEIKSANDSINVSHDSTESGTEGSEKSHAMTVEEKAARDKKTVFVGNLPKETTVQRLSKEFKKFGPIDSLRIRGIVPENPNMSLKVAAIRKKYHPKITTVYAYIVFKKEESVAKALSMNGQIFDGNYLRVDHCEKTKDVDKKKSVFLGNLPFTIEDNELWEAFKDCGKIESVSVVRDGKTGLGRGFGFINFETADGAVLALGLNGSTIKNREVRVNVIVNEANKKQKDKKNKKRQFSGDREDDSSKKMKSENAASVLRATHNSLNAERRKKKNGNQRSQGEKQRMKGESTSPGSNKNQQKFQGQTADLKKKHKQDKTSKKKKQMAAKLLAKPKKRSPM